MTRFLAGHPKRTKVVAQIILWSGVFVLAVLVQLFLERVMDRHPSWIPGRHAEATR